MLGHPASRMIAHPDTVVAEFQFFAIIRAHSKIKGFVCGCVRALALRDRTLAIIAALIQHLPHLQRQDPRRKRLLDESHFGRERAVLRQCPCWVSRGIEQGNLRVQPLDFLGQVRAAELGHHHIGEQQIDPSRDIRARERTASWPSIASRTV